jgi:hypothetical protein
LELVNKRTGEKIVVDIFTALLGIISICALVRTITKILLSPPKAWDQDNWIPEEIDEYSDYKKIRKRNPHIWID